MSKVNKTIESIYKSTRRRMSWFYGRNERNKALNALKDGLYEAYVHGREDYMGTDPKVQVDHDPQPEGDFSNAESWDGEYLHD